MILAPSILSADFAQLGTELRKVERARCTWVHLDVMDNHFVPNLTFGAPVVKALRKISRKLFFDAHLMVENPLSMVEEFAAAGADNLTVHQEACAGDVLRVIKSIKAAKMRPSICIKPATPVSEIEPLLPHVFMVLIMSVEPGFGGQALIPGCLNKLCQLKQLREQRKLGYLIEVDGGINHKTAELAVAAGADVLVAGSAVFKDGLVAANVKLLRESIAAPPA